ncbi:glycosyltransferase family 4 protein [Massilibacteroides sp.]|uniref:glycosyltransferase family 4 protein n=1 Tax=Massilibacteroides sp. TaxID=2034766 RepID=UPI002638934B|nr:glycosyltransferase family 4 protein [Massilibacteroides sp.]MDD4515332.1 glycosyltransferase family 4 protein [Massilibacteroides sp.]
MNRQRVLMIATSKKTKGGITAVLNIYEKFPFWDKYHVKWLETHSDGSNFHKLMFAIKAYFISLTIIPRYSIIHIHLSEAPSLVRKLPLFLYSKLWGKKTVIHFHTNTINNTFFPLYKFVFKNANAVITLSRSVRDWVISSLGAKKECIVIYNPCRQVNTLNIEKEKIVLYAGVLNKKKGYIDLIEAFAQTTKEYPDWTLVLAGNGEIKQGKEYAKKSGIEDLVIFPGWITGEEKHNLFSKASIFCLPSYAEGFPTAILDACSYGIPFITTPVGGIPDIVIDGKNGYLFHPGDIVELKEKISLLMGSTLQRQKLGHAAKDLSQNTFGQKKINEELDKLYQGLLN